MEKLDVLILGAGSLGLSLAVKINEKYGIRKSIGLLCSMRENLLGNLHRKGLIFKEKRNATVQSPSESFHLFNFNMLDSVEIEDNAIVIFSCKSPFIEDIFDKTIPKFVNEGKNFTILLTQEGINTEAIIEKCAKKHRIEKELKAKVMSANISSVAKLVDRNNPEVHYYPGEITLGSWNYEKVSSDHFERVAELLELAGGVMVNKSSKSYITSRYVKSIPTTANILSTLYGITLERVYKNDFLKKIVDNRVKEFIRVSKFLGMDFSYEFISKLLEKIYCQMYPNHFAPMMDDTAKYVRQGRRIVTELDAADLYLVKKAAQAGFSIPTHSFFFSIYKSFETTYNSCFTNGWQQKKATNYAVALINSNARSIGETPFFSEYEEDFTYSIADTMEAKSLAFNFFKTTSAHSHKLID